MSFSLEEPNSKEGNDMPLESETSLQDLHLQKLVLNEPRLNPKSPPTSIALFSDKLAGAAGKTSCTARRR